MIHFVSLLTDFEIFLIIISILIATGISLGVVFAVINNKYKKFVLHHSIALQKLASLNHKYSFYEIDQDFIKHAYDNDVCYENVSCLDYVIGYIRDYFNGVRTKLQRVEVNRSLYKIYKESVSKIEIGFNFDVDTSKFKTNKLLKYQRTLFNANIQHPATYYTMSIRLVHTDMGNNYHGSKSEVFDEAQLKEIIRRLSNKSGKYYNDKEVWDSLVRYERGRVSNKLRFYIYKRDGYRCQRCGRSGRHMDLEIDHIIPVSKGGKTEADNLQTLCRKCNREKGSNIE